MVLKLEMLNFHWLFQRENKSAHSSGILSPLGGASSCQLFHIPSWCRAKVPYQHCFLINIEVYSFQKPHDLEENCAIWQVPDMFFAKEFKIKSVYNFYIVITANFVQLDLVSHLSWLFSSFFQCSLTHYTVLLPADISQKPFFVLDSALPLWPESVWRCSCVVQQCRQHSVSPLIFCCALYWFNLSLRKAREEALFVMVFEVIFFSLFS